jgi:hypothetical protein
MTGIAYCDSCMAEHELTKGGDWPKTYECVDCAIELCDECLQYTIEGDKAIPICSFCERDRRTKEKKDE